MRSRSKYVHFQVSVWSRDCEVPGHQVFDVDYQLVKNCDLCTIYHEHIPIDIVKEVLHDIWMGIPDDVAFEEG